MIDHGETERMLKALLTAVDPLLSIHHIMELDYFMNHHEYGLLLETLVDILSEGEVPTTTLQRIKVVAIHMGMTELSLSGLVASENHLSH